MHAYLYVSFCIQHTVNIIIINHITITATLTSYKIATPRANHQSINHLARNSDMV